MHRARSYIRYAQYGKIGTLSRMLRYHMSLIQKSFFFDQTGCHCPPMVTLFFRRKMCCCLWHRYNVRIWSRICFPGVHVWPSWYSVIDSMLKVHHTYFYIPEQIGSITSRWVVDFRCPPFIYVVYLPFAFIAGEAKQKGDAAYPWYTFTPLVFRGPWIYTV